MAKSPVPTGHDIDTAISRIELVPAGAIRLRFESPKLLVKVTWLVDKVWPLAVLVIYWGIVSTPIF